MPWVREREAGSCKGCAFFELPDRGVECAPGILHDCDNDGTTYLPKDHDNLSQMYLVARVQRKLGVKHHDN